MHLYDTQLYKTGKATDEELRYILTTNDDEFIEDLRNYAVEITKKVYGNKIYIRGLIEFSNYCKEGCKYCGINRTNKNVKRYRLTKEEILKSADIGYKIGFRTIVLQGGEDPYFTDDLFVKIIKGIKEQHYDTAITLSIGVRSESSYKMLKEAGADRFLLRHESADEECFNFIHPEDQSLKKRQDALFSLKKVGFQVGSGILIGAPKSGIETYIKDIHFLRQLKPHMIGIGPFIPQKDTEFKDRIGGDLLTTLKLLAIFRIEHPNALIPSTTALNTIHDNGRIYGIQSGANVVMPNLSPLYARDAYTLYDNKRTSGLECADLVGDLDKYLKRYGYEVSVSRGDYKNV